MLYVTDEKLRDVIAHMRTLVSHSENQSFSTRHLDSLFRLNVAMMYIREGMWTLGQGHTILTSRELMWCYACSWDVRGDWTLNSMAQIATSVTLLTSRDLAWGSGGPTCQHDPHISAVAHISWDVTYVSSALRTLLPIVSRNGGNAYWKSAPTDLFIWHQVPRL